jgi:PAS domain S-box-containing protein
MTYQNFHKLFLLLIFQHLCFVLFAHPEPFTLVNTMQKADLTPYIQYYKDSQNKPVDYITDPENNDIFKPVHDRVINFPNSGHAYWLKFNILNQSKRHDWMFDIDFPTLKQVTVYILNSGGEIDTIMHGGTDNVQSNKLHDYSSVTHPLNISSGEIIRVYVKVQTDAFFILPVKIMTPEHYIQKTIRNHSFLGILFGIILTAMVINILLYAKTHERHTVILLLFLISILLFISQQYGFLKYPQTFIPEYFKTRIRLVLFGCLHLFFNLYTIRFLGLNKYKKLYTILLGVNTFMISYIVVVLLPLIPLARITGINPYLTVFTLMIWTGSGIYSMLRHNKQSKIYLISIVSLILSSFLWLLLTQNMIPLNFFTSHISIIGISVFSMLLTMDAMEKITQLHVEQQKAKQLELLNKKLNSEIEIRKEAEQTLYESENKFRQIFSLSPQAIAISDYTNGKIIDMNEQFCKMTGFEREYLIGKTSLELQFIDPKNRNRLTGELTENNQVLGFEVSFLTGNGEIKHILLNSATISLKDELRMITVFSDITQIINDQTKIRKLSAAIENSANTIIITNNQGEIEYANPAFTKTSGYTFEEIAGNKTSILKSDLHQPSFYQNIWDTILSGKTWNGEICNRRKNGELYWESATISPVTDPYSDTIINFVAIKEDITEKKQHYEELTHSEEQLRNLNATKDKFFSIIGHDLIDPFNALIGFSNILTDALKSKNYDDSLEYASYIQQSAQRVFNLLQNLLIWTKAQSGKVIHKPMVVNIKELVADTLVVLVPNANSKGIDVRMEIGEDTKAVIDYNMIGTVIRNLVMNAIKFTGKGGSIVLKAYTRDGFLNLTVSDTGCGISEKHMGQLFMLDKTFSTKGSNDEAGTGLGLIICKEFIEIHKGTIWAESIEEKGSDFHFRIPAGL